jgi:hypothetical protein
MKEELPAITKALLLFLAAVRGTRAATAVKFLASTFKCTEGAMRKRLDRMAKEGLIVAASLPSGPQLYRLTRKGVQLTGAPVCFSDPPTVAVLYEMIATSNCACQTDKFLFLTRQDFLGIMCERDSAFKADKIPGRFLFHNGLDESSNSPKSQLPGTRLAFWLAEFRPPDQLASRISTVADGLLKTSPLFRELIDHDLFEIAVAVPSEGVQRSLDERQYSVRVTPIVVSELLEFARVPMP